MRVIVRTLCVLFIEFHTSTKKLLFLKSVFAFREIRKKHFVEDVLSLVCVCVFIRTLFRKPELGATF